MTVDPTSPLGADTAAHDLAVTKIPADVPTDDAGGMSANVRRGAIMSGIGLAVTQAVAFLQVLVLARLLSPTEVGIYAAGTVLSAFLMSVTENSLAQALIHRDDEVEAAANTVFWATLGTGLLTSLGALAASPVIGMIFKDSAVGLVAAASAGTMLLHAVTNVPEALMQRRFQTAARTIVAPATTIAFSVSSVCFALAGFREWSLVIASYVSLVVWVLGAWWFGKWRPGAARPSFALWREMATFAFPILVSSVVSRIRELVDLVIVGRVLDPAALGNYRYGRRIAVLPGTAIIVVCAYVLFPAFSRIAKDAVRLKAAFLRALGWIWLASVPIAALMVVVGEPLAVVMLGEPWRGAGVVLMAMAGFGLGEAMNSAAGEAMKGAGRSDRLHWMTLAGIGTGIPLLLLLLPLGLLGVGLAVSISEIVVGLVGLALARSVLDVSIREMAGVMVPALVAGLIALVVWKPLEDFVVHADQHGTLVGFLLIVGVSVCYLLTFVVVLAVVAPRKVRELGTNIRKVVNRVRARSR